MPRSLTEWNDLTRRHNWQNLGNGSMRCRHCEIITKDHQVKRGMGPCSGPTARSLMFGLPSSLSNTDQSSRSSES